MITTKYGMGKGIEHTPCVSGAVRRTTAPSTRCGPSLDGSRFPSDDGRRELHWTRIQMRTHYLFVQNEICNWFTCVEVKPTEVGAILGRHPFEAVPIADTRSRRPLLFPSPSISSVDTWPPIWHSSIPCLWLLLRQHYTVYWHLRTTDDVFWLWISSVHRILIHSW